MGRRSLFTLIGGLLFLVVLTLIGSSVDSWLPAQSSSDLQRATVGSYSLLFQVEPHPPTTGLLDTFTVQVTDASSHKLVTGAQVTLHATMPSMVMNDIVLPAKEVSQGRYQVQTRLEMTGSWRLTVEITRAGAADVQSSFTVAVQ